MSNKVIQVPDGRPQYVSGVRQDKWLDWGATTTETEEWPYRLQPPQTQGVYLEPWRNLSLVQSWNVSLAVRFAVQDSVSTKKINKMNTINISSIWSKFKAGTYALSTAEAKCLSKTMAEPFSWAELKCFSHYSICCTRLCVNK